MKKEVLKQIALKPKWIAHFWGKWSTDKVPNEIRPDTLVLEHKFNENAAPTFLKICDETIAYAGLADSDKVTVNEIVDDEDDFPPPVVNIGDLVQVEINGLHQLDRVRAIRDNQGQNWVFIVGSETCFPMEQVGLHSKGTEQTKASAQSPIFPEAKVDDTLPKGSRREITSFDEGAATLIWPENLSAESVAELEHWLSGILRKAQRRTGITDVQYGTIRQLSLIGGAGLPREDDHTSGSSVR